MSMVNKTRFDNLHVDNKYILYMEDVSVSFNGFKAINALNLYIDKGELRCIIGPNGANKATCSTRCSPPSASNAPPSCSPALRANRPWWWNTTWNSCAKSPAKSPCCTKAAYWPKAVCPKYRPIGR